MSLGLTDKERHQVVYHKLLSLVIGWIVTVGFVVWLYTLVPDYPSFRPNLLVGVVILWSIMWSVTIVNIVLYDWFPDSYYADLRECPQCKTENMKLVHEAKCFNCGYTIDFSLGIPTIDEHEPKGNL